MSNTKKSTKSANGAGAAFKEEVVEAFVPLYTKNVKRLADLQKQSLETAAEQNNELIEACKKAFPAGPETPGLFLFDLFGQSFQRFVETQKGVIDLAVEQSHVVAGLAEERGAYVTNAVEGVTSLVKQSVEHSVAAQKKALDYYSEQHKEAWETAKKQFRIPSNPAVEAVQSGLDILIQTQKAVLDIVSKPFKSEVAA
jgi:hypothetical protein